MDKLTTPELKDFDSVFPGENWFFYWKTSPSLWEAKLRSYQGVTPIYVPIYWALHSEYINQFDFGQTKPETDLKYLVEVAKNVGVNLIFLLPLSPAPFLTNGGLPSYLARSMAVGEDSVALSVWSNQNQLNKLYSFFEPQVFQSFRKFCWNLGQFISNSGVNVEIFGLVSQKMENDKVVSFFSDRSATFEKGFNRYAKQLQDSEPEKIEMAIIDSKYEKILKNEYEKVVFDLYQSSCEELLNPNWGGVIESVFIGASSEDLIKRTNYSWESETSYFKQLFNSYFYEKVPASVLLTEDIKKGPIKSAFTSMVTASKLQGQIGEDFYSEDLSVTFNSLYHFHVVSTKVTDSEQLNTLKNCGLKQFLDTRYSWQYNFQKLVSIDIEELDSSETYLFHGADLDEKSFSLMLKLFMNGQKIFLDKSGIEEKLNHKISDFFLENRIQKEEINFLCPVEKASMGDGLFISYIGSKLSEQSESKKQNFWDKMVSFLNIRSLKVQTHDDIFYYWSARASNAYELNYEQIRRVNFYNPSSYKRKANISASSNFAFIKTLDSQRSSVKSTPSSIEIELMPGAHTVLDFGYFEVD